jgi:hypothetical protein
MADEHDVRQQGVVSLPLLLQLIEGSYLPDPVTLQRQKQIEISAKAVDQRVQKCRFRSEIPDANKRKAKLPVHELRRDALHGIVDTVYEDGSARSVQDQSFQERGTVTRASDRGRRN